ncbi:hypothetical protein BJ912DRAFT_1060265 [Pholiota molesta]|nr:hypothetical protein BJ912DRAFT_1060265 [Pholiota molesta]
MPFPPCRPYAGVQSHLLSYRTMLLLPTTCIVFRDLWSNKDPSGPQNDGEIAEEVDQEHEDEDRLIYSSTLEDKSEGESDAEGIDTTQGIEETHLGGSKLIRTALAASNIQFDISSTSNASSARTS